MCDYLKLTAFDCRLGGYYFQDGRMILISEMALWFLHFWMSLGCSGSSAILWGLYFLSCESRVAYWFVQCNGNWVGEHAFLYTGWLGKKYVGITSKFCNQRTCQNAQVHCLCYWSTFFSMESDHVRLPNTSLVLVVRCFNRYPGSPVLQQRQLRSPYVEQNKLCVLTLS